MRATPETVVDHAALTAYRAAGVAVTTQADGDAIRSDQHARNGRSTGGIGRYTQFNNYAAYHALRAIADALPPSRMDVEIFGLAR